jgi:FAD dependent oxidoreductase TIGR03364
MEHRANVAVVGAGIVGLSHAWAAAKRGLSVVLFERDHKAQGASIRNFGMLWPIGQPAGELHGRALRSRQAWLELASQAGIWHDPCGSLHLAYRADELALLEEFVGAAPELGYEVALLTPNQVLRKCPAVRAEGLLGGLWSPTEVCVDPRQALARLPLWLRERHGVELWFGSVVANVEMPYLRTSDGQTWKADRVIVCSGVDFQTLFPQVYAISGIRRCKLQMMRTVPQPGGWRIGAMLAAGLTLCHYAAFKVCPSLPRLAQRIRTEMPEYVRFGIHVMAAQNHLGEVVIGDSHEYEEDIQPWDKRHIDELILGYLRGLVSLPDQEVAERWHGVYAKHPTLPLFTAEPQPGVHIVNAVGGAGMTMSFGTAEDLWTRWS